MKSKIAFWKTIRFKYTFIVFVAILVVVSGMLLFSSNRSKHNQQVYQDRTNERKESFRVISSLESQNLKSLTIENTYWDDMVAYIANPEPTFENEVLKAQLDTYEADVIWAYNPNHQLVSNLSTTGFGDNKIELGLDKGELEAMFKDDYLTHFYRNTDVGLIEVFGATVHGSEDVEHATPAEGYFFVARKLDREYLSKLESATKDTIELTAVGVSTSLPPSNEATGDITFTNTLKDEAGFTVANLHASYESKAIAGLYQSLAALLPTAIAFLVMVFLIIYYVLHRMIIHPLNTVYLSLRTDDVSILSDLQSKDTEFGRIASLMIESQRQKEEIIETSAVMKQTQDKLEARTKEIEAINGLMINRELRMTELKQENSRLKKDKK